MLAPQLFLFGWNFGILQALAAPVLCGIGGPWTAVHLQADEHEGEGAWWACYDPAGFVMVLFDALILHPLCVIWQCE